ncbi:c-type cytochrome [Shewanella nanhaiensis]|uniref:C-type cytochrome n=1 Tax=Shewanella nanhaiensis TaxID=2864872 RepID=A0ABS7EAJ2_9GAMM|nr:c-type cytochrome [Shewanella nanhaiensis]MBW8186620.1 c-type cytochrome [Shewanella nanhaiensis]
MKISSFISLFFFLSIHIFPTYAQSQDDGARLYSHHCTLCHGNKGMGDGYIPMKLKGYPQTNLFDEQNAIDKESIIDVISRGFPNEDIIKFMPPWEQELTKEEISDLATFVLFLRSDTEAALRTLSKYTDKLDKTVRDGKIIFETRCALCHGKLGQGDGRMARIIKTPPPANLTRSILNPVQMRLIIKLGGQEVGRSPKMPPWGDFMTDNEVDAVVDFIDTLKD